MPPRAFVVLERARHSAQFREALAANKPSAPRECLAIHGEGGKRLVHVRVQRTELHGVRAALGPLHVLRAAIVAASQAGRQMYEVAIHCFALFLTFKKGAAATTHPHFKAHKDVLEVSPTPVALWRLLA
jgi:hypothetical protein